MAVENKQDGIIEELTRRIEDGVYEERLPAALALAEEFQVNFKTMNRAIIRMAEMGLVIRKPKHGTLIVKNKTNLEDTLIELIYVGSSDPGNHPFYGPIWQGILDGLEGTIYRVVLNRLEEDLENGGLREPCKDFTPSAGKILVGSSNAQQIKLLQKQKCPFVLAGSKPIDNSVYCTYADLTPAINKVIGYLRSKNIQDIAYIGTTVDSGELLLDLEKFHTYLSAIQQQGNFDSDLIENTPPFAASGYTAMVNILRRKQPQAVLVAYDHLCPNVYQAIEEAGLKVNKDIEVIGLDGTCPVLIPPLKSIRFDRHEIGRKAGDLLLEIIRTPSKRRDRQHIIKSDFDYV